MYEYYHWKDIYCSRIWQCATKKKKKEALYHYQISNLKHENGQLPKESHGYRDNDLIFFKKEMDIIYSSILGIPGKIKVTSSFPLETRHWWNDLPVDIRMANSLLPFKSLHKTYIKIKELLFHHPCLFSPRDQ